MYNVGDKVRVRDWDDMESEYGSWDTENPAHGIVLHTLCLQYNKIAHMCGRSYHIKEVISNPFFGDQLYILDGEDYMMPEDSLILCKEENNNEGT